MAAAVVDLLSVVFLPFAILFSDVFQVFAVQYQIETVRYLTVIAKRLINCKSGRYEIE